MMANNGGEGAASGLPQQYQFSNMTFTQSPQGTFLPSEITSGSQQDLQVKLIERQIEVVP